MKRAVLLLLALLAVPVAAVAADRNLLWHVVQACVASNKMLGVSFPCLEVDLAGGAERGYAVVRAPFTGSHIVVTPTVRTIGVEADRLRSSAAPNYFAMAWAARNFALEGIDHPVGRDELALAVNSRPGRSQDQLHIHVDCLRQAVRRSVGAALGGLRPGAWAPIAVLPRGPRYLATVLGERAFATANIFDLVQNGLRVTPQAMEDVTIVVAGATVDDKPGFVVLARRRIPNSNDEAHGEALMDHSCSALRRADRASDAERSGAPDLDAHASNPHGHEDVKG